jgi:hypothetical protein
MVSPAFMIVATTRGQGWNGYGGSFFEQALTKPNGALEGGDDLKVVAKRLFDLKTDIRYGEEPDAFGNRIVTKYDIRLNSDELNKIPACLSPAQQAVVQAELVRLGLPQHQQKQLAEAKAQIEQQRAVQSAKLKVAAPGS